MQSCRLQYWRRAAVRASVTISDAEIEHIRICVLQLQASSAAKAIVDTLYTTVVYLL